MVSVDKKFSPGYKLSLLSETSTLRDAITSINKSGLMVCCIVGADQKLLGLLTDSDIRRLMLSSVSLDKMALDVCNRMPLVCNEVTSAQELTQLARREGKREIPIIDAHNRVADIFILGLAEERTVMTASVGLTSRAPIDAEMFVLAGGLGTRLRPVVADRPKPLAEVGGATIIDHVINHAVACGVPKFYFSLNYKAEMIEDHIVGKYRDLVDYEFIKEPIRLGTAGPLSLVADRVRKPLFVVNADLLTDLDYRSVFLEHINSRSDATIVVRKHSLNIPYGEVHLDGGSVGRIVEKPSKSYLINAGIYLLQPELLNFVPADQYFDMPNFLTDLIAQDKVLKPFYMHEEWIDIGKPEDYKKANSDFGYRANRFHIEY